MLFLLTTLLLFSGRALSVEPVVLRWSHQPNAIYRIQIATDKGFKNVVRDERLETGSFTFSDYELGKYYWKIKAKYPEEESWSYESDVATIDLELGPLNPKGPKELRIMENKALAKFEWSASQAFPRYVFTLSKDDKEFFKSEVLREAKFQIHLEEGAYTWHVEQMNEKGMLLQKSRPQRLVIHPKKKISGPKSRRAACGLQYSKIFFDQEVDADEVPLESGDFYAAGANCNYRHKKNFGVFHSLEAQAEAQRVFASFAAGDQYELDDFNLFRGGAGLVANWKPAAQDTPLLLKTSIELRSIPFFKIQGSEVALETEYHFLVVQSVLKKWSANEGLGHMVEASIGAGVASYFGKLNYWLEYSPKKNKFNISSLLSGIALESLSATNKSAEIQNSFSIGSLNLSAVWRY